MSYLTGNSLNPSNLTGVSTVNTGNITLSNIQPNSILMSNNSQKIDASGYLKSDISDMLENISTIQSNQANDEGNILELQNSVSAIQNNQNIDEGNIASIQSNQTNDEQNISNLQITVSTIQGNQIEDETNINNIQNTINQIQQSQTTDEAAIGVLQQNIIDFSNSINTNAGNISSLQSSKTTDETNITNLQNSVLTLDSLVGVLQSQVATLQSQVTDLENALGSGGSGGSGGECLISVGDQNNLIAFCEVIDNAVGTGNTIPYTNIAGNIWNLFGGNNAQLSTANGEFIVQIPDVGAFMQICKDSQNGYSYIQTPLDIIDNANTNTQSTSSFANINQNSALKIENSSLDNNGVTNPNPYYLLDLEYDSTNSNTTDNPQSLNFANMVCNGVQYGSIGNNGSGAVFLTVSDERIKNNVNPINTIDHYIALKNNPNLVKSFNVRNNPNLSTGVVAQEIQQVFPDAVNGDPNSDPTKNPMSVDYGKLSVFCLSALTESIKEIETLKKTVKLLKKN